MLTNLYCSCRCFRVTHDAAAGRSATVTGAASSRMVGKAGLAAGLLLSLALAQSAYAADAREGDRRGSASEKHRVDVGMEGAETQAAMAFLSALGRLDFDGAGALLDDDTVLDLPFAGAGHVVTGRAQVLTFFRDTMTGKIAQIAYHLDHAYPSREPGATVLEVSTKVEGPQGGTVSNRFVAIFRFRRGKIVLFREYFNPAPIVALQRQ
jgi:ketosteroid isomerase-like protein